MRRSRSAARRSSRREVRYSSIRGRRFVQTRGKGGASESCEQSANREWEDALRGVMTFASVTRRDVAHAESKLMVGSAIKCVAWTKANALGLMPASCEKSTFDPARAKVSVASSSPTNEMNSLDLPRRTNLLSPQLCLRPLLAEAAIKSLGILRATLSSSTKKKGERRTRSYLRRYAQAFSRCAIRSVWHLW